MRLWMVSRGNRPALTCRLVGCKACLFPRDTIQSRMPDPEWLEHWLDKQIQFDAVWENKVVDRILHNLSLLMERSFASVQELNRFRKEMVAAVAAAQARLRPV